MTTLRELLDDALHNGHQHLEVLMAIESWAYGEERECPGCFGGRIEGGKLHAACHGTGKTREPGLVERVFFASGEFCGDENTGANGGPCVLAPHDPVLPHWGEGDVAGDWTPPWLAALRQELGEVTP